MCMCVHARVCVCVTFFSLCKLTTNNRQSFKNVSWITHHQTIFSQWQIQKLSLSSSFSYIGLLLYKAKWLFLPLSLSISDWREEGRYIWLGNSPKGVSFGLPQAVSLLCVFIKYRTSTFPCQHLDSVEILHKLQCFETSLAMKNVLHVCLCTFTISPYMQQFLN